MLTLYVKTGCPYCAMVLHTLEELKLPFEEKNIADEAVATELTEKGGELLVPYLIDSEHNIAMYESSDIVNYLTETYCGTAPKGTDAPGVCLPE